MNYRYLIICRGIYSVFFTQYYDYSNNWSPLSYLYVFDFHLLKFTTDGHTWHDIIFDHL